MKINIPEIEQKLYYNICSNFAKWCEMQLKQYDSTLKFLDSITVEILTGTIITELYQQYVDFCNEHSLDCLSDKMFTTVITSFGYYRFQTHNKDIMNGKSIGYFRPVTQERK